MIVFMVEDDSCDDHKNIACYSTREAAESRRKQEHRSHVQRVRKFYEGVSFHADTLKDTFAVYEYEVLDA